MKTLLNLILMVTVFTLSACGGGGNSGANNTDDNSDPAPVTHSVSGRVDFAVNLVVDNDVNASAAASGNNTAATAQALPHNRVKVQGFVSDSVQGGNDADPIDVYRVFLQQGQSISLEVVNAPNASSSGGELALSVSDVAASFQLLPDVNDNIQTIEAPADTEYLIEVAATQGASRYVLTLTATSASLPDPSISAPDPIANSTLVAPFALPNDSAEPVLVLRSAIVKWKSTSSDWAFDTVNLSDIYTSDNLDWTDAETTWAAIELMNQRDDVEYAEPNYVSKPLALIPNDPLYAAPLEAPAFAISPDGGIDFTQFLGGIPINQNSNSGLVVDSSFITQYHYEQIGLPEAWEDIVLETGRQPGEGVIVAVSDTGVFVDHEDLANQLTSDGFDFISDPVSAKDNESDNLSDDRDSNPDDPGDGIDIISSSWHGTHVAGTIAAESNNNIGLAGVAWESQIMPLRVLGANGSGSGNDIMDSLIYAADLNPQNRPLQRADIVNLSLGRGGLALNSEQAVIDSLRAAGVFVVAAAGNDGSRALSFPASYDGVISVSAIDARKQRARYSQFNSQVDVAAPGGLFLVDDAVNPTFAACVGVFSTFVSEGGDSGARDSSTFCLQGTSMATPHVSGVIALMRSIYPQLTPDEFDELLARGEITDDLGPEGRDDAFGHGLINAEKAVQAAIALAAEQPLQTPQLSGSAASLIFNDATTTIAFDLENNNSAASDPQVTVEKTADWIVVDDTATVDGMGRYQISTNSTGFGTGVYQGSIRFTPTAGNPIAVEVELTVGTPQSDHPQAPHFVLFVDSQGNTAGSTEVAPDGVYTAELAEGDYFVVTGTDIDVDQIICQVGETCGTVTNLLAGEPLTVNQDQVSLDIDVSLVESSTPQPVLRVSSELQQVHGSFAVQR